MRPKSGAPGLQPNRCGPTGSRWFVSPERRMVSSVHPYLHLSSWHRGQAVWSDGSVRPKISEEAQTWLRVSRLSFLVLSIQISRFQYLGFPLHFQDPSLAVLALLSLQYCSILPPRPGFSPRLALSHVHKVDLIVSTKPGYFLSAENTVYG